MGESAVLERTRHLTPLHHLKQETAAAGRPGLLLTSNKRLVSHMNEATKTANELLLREKEALEGAGKFKRENKQVVHETLQSLYEIVLSLS